MNCLLHWIKRLIFVLSIFILLGPLSPQVFAQNGVMMQYFHWYYPVGWTGITSGSF